MNKDAISSFARRTLFIIAGLVGLGAAASAGAFYYALQYEDRIYPNTYIGDIPVSGLTQEQALNRIQASYERMLDQGMHVELNGQTYTVDLQVTGDTDPDLNYQLINVETEALAQEAFNSGHQRTEIGEILAGMKSIFIPTTIHIPVEILEDQIINALDAEFAEMQMEKQETNYHFIHDDGEWTIEVIPGIAGKTIDTDLVFAQIRNDIQDLSLNQYILKLIIDDYLVTTAQATELKPDALHALDHTPLVLTYTSEVGAEKEWEISEEDLAAWIMPGHDGLVLDQVAMDDFLSSISEEINIDPIDARFEIIDGKVQEFVGSQSGIEFDAEATVTLLTDAIRNEDSDIAISVNVVEPDILTADVNDLGIVEIIGVGTSDFSGSDWNRIQNILHGSEKLDGLLIPPGESTGLVKHLRPFTLEDGYKLGYAILGDEIKPEIGGGLCQLGTTTFRAAMNSGLTIEERRNHSLVVSYYDDPQNGNPGTDATLYDTGNDNTVVDLVISNDTENHVLMTTHVDVDTRTLTYTFWGTSDGRNGYYTPPQVLSWKGYGETVYKDTEDLPPGKTKCQAPYSGATTSFDYIVEYADGETHEQNFTSYYRSLPRICLVGIDPDAPEEEDVIE